MKQVEKKYDVLIIGGGPAGIFAAYLAHVKGLRPLLIETSDNLGGQPLNLYGQKKVYDYPGFTNITATQLVDIFTKQLTNEKQIPVLLNTSLISVNRTKNEYVVSLNNNRTVQAKYIIIATGAGLFTPNILQIPGVTSKNTCYSISQMNVYSNKQIVILGGGDSAVDWANELAEQVKCKSIYIVHRRNEFRAHGDNVQRLKTNKIKILLEHIPVSISGKKLTVESNVTHKQQVIPFDKIVVQYGQTVKQDIFNTFSDLKLVNTNKIEVACNQLTNLKNIYAIGDVCFYKDKPSSLICAHGEAAVAVRSIINDLRQYDKK